MQVVNNLIFDSTLAADGAWRNISNFVSCSIQATGLEGNVWIEVSNDPNVQYSGASALAAPATPVLSQFAIGALTNQGTYYVKTTYVTNVGETLASLEASLAVNDLNELIVRSPAADASGLAVAYNVYVGKTTGTEVLQSSSPILLTRSFLLSAFMNTGIAPPVANTAGSPNIGLNASGNLVTGTGQPTGDEIIIVPDVAGAATQAIWAPSCLVWNWIRVRKDNSVQTKETKAYLFGQNG